MLQKFIAVFLLFIPVIIYARQYDESLLEEKNFQQQEEEFTVTGTVIDGEDRMPLQGAHVSLTDYRDTTIVHNAVTDDSGVFSVSVSPGSYILRVSFIGFRNVVLEDPVEISDPETDIGTVIMAEGEELEEIEVRAVRPGAILRGDTLDFHAAAYRLNPDATTEDLVRRMAGIRVDDDGVTAEGEEVERVLVDGREFFGDDPTVALRNLPAEVVERIEVYDRMSDQAELTGFDDGERSKTINIVTRLDARSSQFGRIYSGYGGYDRYQAGITTNIFSETSRLSIIGMSNNINEQNFSREDIMTLTAGSARGGRGGGGGGGPPGGMSGGGMPGGGMPHVRDFRMGPEPGENTTHALGLNYSDVWLDERLEMTGSYFFNISDNYTDQLTDREYLVDEYDNQVYFEDSESSSQRNNHRMHMRVTYDIDENNSLIFTPRLTLQNNLSDEHTYARNLLSAGDPLSMTETFYDSDMSGYNFGGSLLYRHRINDEGRSLSTRINANFNNNTSLYYLDAINEYFTGDGEGFPDETVISEYMDQKSDSETINNTLSSNITYTEPLGENGMLQASYNISRSANESDRITSSFEEESGSYTGFEPDLSTRLESSYLTHRGSLGYRLRGEGYNLTLEMGYQHARLSADQEFPYDHRVSRDFTNFLPRLMLNYNIGEGRNLRFTYRTNTSAPSVTQLQDVVDNTNPTLLSSGNPDLDHSYSHFFMTRYNHTNTEKATNFVAFLFANFTNNHIGNSTIIARSDTTLANGLELPRGSQFSQPVNLDGQAHIRANLDYGFPVRFIRSNLNINGGLAYIRTPGLINDRENIANNYSVSGGLSLTSNISQNIDFTLSYRGTYNMVENSIQPEMDNNYFYHRGGARFSLIFLEDWVFRSDLSHRMYAGLGDDFNQDYILWSINLGRKFFQNNQGELTLSVFDLLGQNDNVMRNVSDMYVEDYRTNELTRYFMLTFTYNLRNFNLQDSPPVR